MPILDDKPIDLTKPKSKPFVPQKPLSTAEKRLISAVEAVPFKKRHKQFTDRQLSQYEKAKMRLGSSLKPSEGIKGEIRFGKIKRVPNPKPKPMTQAEKDKRTRDQLTKT